MNNQDIDPLKYGECSHGAQMIIERMHTHPKDFEDGEFYRFVAHGYAMSARDAAAVQAAYGELILEPKLAQDVITSLMDPQKPVQFREAMRLSSNGNLGIGTTPAWGVAAGTPGVWVDGEQFTGAMIK